MTAEETRVYMREYMKKWRAQNPEKVKTYRQNTMRRRYVDELLATVQGRPSGRQKAPETARNEGSE